MKTLTLHNIIGYTLGLVMLVGGFFAMHQTASAAASFTGGQHPVMRSANYSANPGQINWYAEGATYASINSNQIAAVTVFYENTGTTAAQGVRLRITPQQSSSQQSHTFSGAVMSSSTNTVSGSTTVAVNGGSQPLAHVPGSGIHHRSYGSDINLSQSQINQLFSSTGLHIGTIQPGQAGGIVVHYRVPQTAEPEPTITEPSAITLAAQSVAQTSATLRGDYDGFGQGVDTQFRYSTNSNNVHNGTTTPWASQGNGSGEANRSVSGLQPNTTYYYQICVRLQQDNSIVVCGSNQQFTTPAQMAIDLSIDMQTNSATQEATTSARLRGEVVFGNNATVWFALTTGSNPSCTSSNQRRDVSGSYNTGDSFNVVATGLSSNTNYNYRACGELPLGQTAQGSIQSFATLSGQTTPVNDGVMVRTDTPNQISTTSARLRGSVLEGEEITTWFAFTTGANPSCTNSSHRQNVSGMYDEGDAFSRVVTGLSSNSTYRYRACGESASGDIHSGGSRSFQTESSGGGLIVQPPVSDTANVTSCVVVSTGTSIATVRAAYTTDTAGTAYFEYGPGTSYAFNTASTSVSSTGLSQQILTGLQPDTQYSCRLVVINDAGTTFGQGTTFRTNAVSAAVGGGTTTVTNNTTVVSGGEGRFVTLLIDNDQEVAYRGQFARYVVEYSNISNRDLDQVGLLITLPQSARFISSSHGNYNRRDHTVYHRVGTLEEGREGLMTIDVRYGAGRAGDPIVAQATLAFENPDNRGNAFINAIEFDADTYASGVGLGAGLFGLGFPTTFGEWLLFLLLIVLVILGARYFYNRNKERQARIAMMSAQERAHQASINQHMMNNGNQYGMQGNGGNNGNGYGQGSNDMYRNSNDQYNN